MATTLLGHIEPFDPDTDDWLQYVERMEQMFTANDLVGAKKAEKRRSIFLFVVGKRTYGILRRLLHNPNRKRSLLLKRLKRTPEKNIRNVFVHKYC